MTYNNILEIPVEKGKKYLSEVFEDGYLPAGILNKVTTGCGGTTVALESPFDYIVFVPTIELIKNKAEEYKGGRPCRFNHNEYKVEIFQVYGTFNELKDNLNNHIREARHYEDPVKIIATYDSAPKLIDFLGDSFVRGCYILVDEFHSLMIDYNIRYNAVEALINTLISHPKVTYMSATPLNPKYGPFQLQHLPVKIVKWENITKPLVTLVESKAPILSVRAIIGFDLENRPLLHTELDGQPIYPEQYFFFINNVDHIKKIVTGFIKEVRDQICIVCTDRDKNRNTLGDLYELVGSTCSLKRYNFLTKRSFYGCDIKSSRGLSIVVTNVKSEVTLLDVNTDIIQIAGRIRNEENPFKNSLVHIYNRQPEDISEDRMYKLVQNSINELKLKDANIENLRRHLLFRNFLYNETYNSLNKAYESAQISYSEIDIKTCFYPELTEHYIGGFTKNLKEFYIHKINSDSEETLPNHLVIFLKDYPFIEQAIDILGISKLNSLGFKEKRIRMELKKRTEIETNRYQSIRMLEEKISIGKIYTRDYIISTLQEIYYSLGIERIAKAIDISVYYEVKKTTTSKGQNGSTGAMKIIALKEEIPTSLPIKDIV